MRMSLEIFGQVPFTTVGDAGVNRNKFVNDVASQLRFLHQWCFRSSGFLGLGQQLVAPSLQQVRNLACHVAVDRVGHGQDVSLRLL